MGVEFGSHGVGHPTGVGSPLPLRSARFGPSTSTSDCSATRQSWSSWPSLPKRSTESASWCRITSTRATPSGRSTTTGGRSPPSPAGCPSAFKSDTTPPLALPGRPPKPRRSTVSLGDRPIEASVRHPLPITPTSVTPPAHRCVPLSSTEPLPGQAGPLPGHDE